MEIPAAVIQLSGCHDLNTAYGDLVFNVTATIDVAHSIQPGVILKHTIHGPTCWIRQNLMMPDRVSTPTTPSNIIDGEGI